MPVVKNVFYKDVDTLFGNHPVTRKLNTLTNNAAVARAVKNLILTNKGERPYQPMLGSDVTRQLFELNDGLVENNLQEAIELVIQNYEPRAELINIEASPDEDNNTLNIAIIFSLVNSDVEEQLSLVLERVR